MAETPLPGARWQIVARKYDGSLHYVLPAEFISDDGERLVLRARPGDLLDHRTRGWVRPMRRVSEMIFWRGRWYNLYRNMRLDDSTALDHVYCNISLPPLITGRQISFVDLDLDVQCWPDGRVEVLDEDEFIEHAARYAYPADVQQHAREAVAELLRLWERHLPPFEE